ncbi:MAG: hypothetical protein AAGA18_08685 [Verrucomicrobiota bacterium]
MDEIEKKHKEYYQQQKLSSKRVEEILTSAKEVELEVPWWRKNAGILLRVAAFLLMFGIIFTFSLKDSRKNDLGSTVARDLIKNHNKQLRPEIVSSSYNEIQGYLTRMTVSVEPAEIFLEKFEIIGGRYCSVQGELAAQLKVREKESNRMGSLYVCSDKSMLDRIRPDVYEINSQLVEIWKDKGRIFFLVL